MCVCVRDCRRNVKENKDVRFGRSCWQLLSLEQFSVLMMNCLRDWDVKRSQSFARRSVAAHAQHVTKETTVTLLFFHLSSLLACLNIICIQRHNWGSRHPPPYFYSTDVFKARAACQRWQAEGFLCNTHAGYATQTRSSFKLQWKCLATQEYLKGQFKLQI